MKQKPKPQVTQEVMPVGEHRAPAPHIASYLEQIRTGALDRQNRLNAQARDDKHDVLRIIADLEDWRNEIDATIAFLKATHH